MKVFKRSKAYGALEYTLIIALIIVIAILILNFIRNRTHGVPWMDSANDKVSEYIGGSSGDPGGETPVGSNIELHFENYPLPAFDIKEGETLTKEQIKQYITTNNGVVKNKTTLAEISTYEIEDITYNPFDATVYIQFKVTSLEGDAVSQIPGNILAELADGCVLATDSDFSGTTDGDFKYIGTATCVKIPPVIKGTEVYSYERMFEGTAIEKVISTNPSIEYMGAMFAETTSSQIDLTNLDTSSAKDFGWMFYESKATNIIFGENFKTSEVTNMQGMFASSMVQDLDLSNFDTSKVTDMKSMFASSKAQNINLSKFNTSKVTNMDKMFASSMVEELNLSSFETSNVTNMDRMFYGSNVKNLDLSNFDTSSLVDVLDTENSWYIGGACWMFRDSKIETLQLGPNFKLEHIKFLGNIFYNSSITELDVSNIDFSVSSSTPDPGGMKLFLNGSKISTLYVKDQNMKDLINSIPLEFRSSLTQIKIKGD